MAATNNRMIIRSSGTGNVKTVSLYNAANGAVGTFLKCDTSQIATANSGDFLKLPDGMLAVLQDFQAGAASGEIQIIADGAPTGFYIGYDAQQPNNAGRAIPLGFIFKGGVLYQFRVEAILPA